MNREERLSRKVMTHIGLAYAVGLIGVFTASYVYYGYKNDLSQIRSEFDELKKSENNPIFKSVTVNDKNGKPYLKISDGGIYIQGPEYETILEGSGVLLRSYDRTSYARVNLHQIILSEKNDTSMSRMTNTWISMIKTNGTNTNLAGIGSVDSPNGGALGLYTLRGTIGDKPDLKNAVMISPEDIKIFDENYKLRTSLGVTDLKNNLSGSTERTAPSALFLFNKDGKVIARLPAFP